LFALLFFSKAKKELPLVAFFRQEKIQQSFTSLSIAIAARVAVVSSELTIKKTFTCNLRQISLLKNTFKKRLEKIWKE
jgi:hypothetical protein